VKSGCLSLIAPEAVPVAKSSGADDVEPHTVSLNSGRALMMRHAWLLGRLWVCLALGHADGLLD
jgi:hypothetical protein